MSRYVFFFLLAAELRLAAQSTATLTGAVKDPSGAMVPGATVVCVNTQTSLTLRTATNEDGLFRLPEVPVGFYSLTVSHAGFSKLVRGPIELVTGQTADMSLTLQVGEASQAIEVAAEVPLVQTTTSDVQTTVSSRQMSELPLNGRNAFQLAELVPGAVTTFASTVTGQQDNTGLSVNGSRPYDNNWQLDGGTYVNVNYGSAPTLPNPDTLQEFTAITSNFSAANRGSGAVIKVTTRSGGNQVHGSLFEFLRNTSLDARNFFSVNAEVYKQNQYGGTVGGPIRKNKTFYFGSYQGTKKRGSPSPLLNTVPSAAQHQGDFSLTGHPIVDPVSGEPFPANIIPQSRMDPVATKLLTYLALPNSGPNTLVMPPAANKGDDQFVVKIDQVFSEKDHLSGRYFWDQNTFQRDLTSFPGFYGADRFRNQTVLVTETHTFSPSWVMDNSFNYLQTFRTEQPTAPVYTKDLGLDANIPAAQADVPYPQINIQFTGYTRVYSSRSVVFNPASFEFSSSVSHPAGSHFLQFGGNVRHNHQTSINVADPFGAWVFGAQQTSSATIKSSGDAVASFLLGVPQTFNQSANPPTQLFVATLFAGWVQDDWKVSRRVTLNLGLRYDPWLPPRDAAGVIPAFVPGAHSTLAPLAPAGLLFSGDPGIPAAVLHSYWKRFSPRFGFAWDVAGDGKTVVRGGYGIYQTTSEMYEFLRNITGSAPTRGSSVGITAPRSTENPYAGVAGGSPFPFTPPTGTQLADYKFPANLALQAIDPSADPKYSENWNLAVERRLRADTAVSVAYIGNHFLGTLSTVNANPAVYAAGATVANEVQRRLYPAFSSITWGTAYNHGSYNGLQVQLTKRPVRGLALLVNYSFAKALDINSTGIFFPGPAQLPRDPFNYNLNKGPADYDVRHSTKGSVLYELPKLGSGSAWVKAFVNGWQVNTILAEYTGLGIGCRSGSDNSFTGLNTDFCDQVLPSIARTAGSDSLKQWFNTKAFASNAFGTYGNTGRNIIRRPGTFNLDISLFRKIPLGERFLGELRVETFNVLNHPNFDLIAATGATTVAYTSPTFGQITYASDPRLVQIALKLKF
jgi:hypothetical protein